MIIEVDGLSKTYREVNAISDLSLSVEKGDVFGMLGQNGAGKSTLVAALLGLIRPDSGSQVKLFGEEVTAGRSRGLRSRVGVVGEAPQLQDDRTALDYLMFFARLYRVESPEEKVVRRLRQVGLFDAAARRVRSMSRGMKQRLSLARALLHDPELLILDEPVNGLDPQGIRDVRELLASENQAGKTIFMCSHLLSEVEKSCNRIAIIHRGSLLVSGETPEIAQGDLEEAFVRMTSGSER